MLFLRQWLLGVVACAMLVSMAGQICPEGSSRTLVRFTGGLLLLLTMLRPLGEIRPGGLAWEPGSYREAVARLETELGIERENAMADGIAEALAAYIEDKAGSMGAAVRAEVEMETRGGLPVPERVILRGARSGELSAWITAELGVAEEKQLWLENE